MKKLLFAVSIACGLSLLSGCFVEADYPSDEYCNEYGECVPVHYVGGVPYYWYGGAWIGPSHPYYYRYHGYYGHYGWHGGYRGGYHGGWHHR